MQHSTSSLATLKMIHCKQRQDLTRQNPSYRQTFRSKRGRGGGAWGGSRSRSRRGRRGKEVSYLDSRSLPTYLVGATPLSSFPVAWRSQGAKMREQGGRGGTRAHRKPLAIAPTLMAMDVVGQGGRERGREWGAARQWRDRRADVWAQAAGAVGVEREREREGVQGHGTRWERIKSQGARHSRLVFKLCGPVWSVGTP